MQLPKVVKVAVEQTAFHFDKLYSYLWPDTFGSPQRGVRVLVPFGGGNRRRQGVVMDCDSPAEVEKLKPVYLVLDPAPLFDSEMLDLALWLKERTFCTVFEALHAMVPPAFYLRVRPTYTLAEGVTAERIRTLSDEEQRAVSLIGGTPGGLERSALLRKLGLRVDNPLPDRLLKKGIVAQTEEAFRTMGDATVRMVRLAMSGEELAGAALLRPLTEKQKRVVALLQEAGCASVKEMCYFASVTPSVIATLEKYGVLETYDSEVLRSPARATSLPQQPPAELSGEQEEAFAGLRALYRTHQAKAALLYGVTGSGKTQVYMKLIDEAVADGRQAMVLVPEISLTPQMLELFLARYGHRVAVLHSGLSLGERMDEWKRIRRGEAAIVVGTRSAVFAPCEKLGLLILDEEQEHTYKSENSPRYHARDVARYRAAYHGALLVLSSATPSVETYHKALAGQYALFTLSSRYGNARLPAVEVVDMRREEADGSCISETLRRELYDCLSRGKQAILLLNRRGYNTFVSCRKCGHVITCPQCSISMTYHSANAQLVCHYCGHMCEPVTRCPACGSDKVRYSGLGTQRVEQELRELFPDVPVLRMDTDTTLSRYAYAQKFEAFGRGDYRIMIGTQMVAKGLDFPHVELVGVLSADQSLYGDDFRCFETTFSLLTQVIGRAGRRETQGKAVIQTYTPENYVIELAARQDYPTFYRTEIAARKAMRYPPYTDLCLFGFVGPQEADVKEASGRFLRLLHRAATGQYRDVPMIVLDPAPATVLKAAGKYRYKLLVKLAATARARTMIGELLTVFSRDPENKHITVFADLNPATML